MLPNLTECIFKDEDYPAFRGGFGDIWKCTLHSGDWKIKVAVKVSRVYTSDPPDMVAKKTTRIAHELKMSANLRHANIMSACGYTHRFGPYKAIVSYWAENGNLTDYLGHAGGALTLDRRFQMLKDIISGLEYLHAKRVIHGDLSGANVLIHGDGTACLADFGLSLMYSEGTSASQASWTSTFKGNARWMAPERLVGHEDGSLVRPTEQGDIYSFGGIMLLVLTNRVPYYYIQHDIGISLQIARSQTPSRSQYHLPEKYWLFIEQCWSTHPLDRPSAAEVVGKIRSELIDCRNLPDSTEFVFTDLSTVQLVDI